MVWPSEYHIAAWQSGNIAVWHQNVWFSTRARPSGGLAHASVLLPPDPKIHQKSMTFQGLAIRIPYGSLAVWQYRCMASKCMVFFARGPSGGLTHASVLLLPDPKIHQKSMKIHGLAIRIPYGSLAVWQYGCMSSKRMVFYAREALRWLNPRISPSTSGPQNPSKIDENP